MNCSSTDGFPARFHLNKFGLPLKDVLLQMPKVNISYGLTLNQSLDLQVDLQLTDHKHVY